MTAPSLLDELEGVMRLSDAASFQVLDWGWRNDDDAPGSIFTHSSGGLNQAVAMCPRYGKDNFASDANYIIAMHNFIRAHHATIAAMAKRLEAAERDAARYRWLLNQSVRIEARAWVWEPNEPEMMHPDERFDAATQEGEG
jgi:hypothetical protein